MKKINKFALVCVPAIMLLTGCEFLQSTLSSYQEEALAEATGNPSYGYKAWYYNGIASENMAETVDNELYKETLKIDFGKKVTIGSLNGSITVRYTDSNGNARTDITKNIRGSLSPDYTSFYLDMSYIIGHFDASEVTSGTASVDIKLSGFICAEGEQKGRKLNVFELNNLQIKPLFNATEYTLSTIGFEKNVTKYQVPLNGEFDFENASATGTDSASNKYEFTLTADGATLCLTPEFEAPADGTVVILPVGIIPNGTGAAYEKNLTFKFSKHRISIDGIMDTNYTASGTASYAEDETGDSVTNGYDGSTDLTGLYVTNDDDYLYVAITGAISLEWYDGLAIMVSKDHSYDVHSDSAVTTGKEGFRVADAMSFGRDSLAHGKPDYYLFHRPYFEVLKAWVENTAAAEDVSLNVMTSGLGTTSGTFIEYAIPMTDLAKAGIAKGDTVHVLAAFSAHWDEGVFLSDVVPNESVTTGIGTKSVTVNFQNALGLTLN